MYTFIQKVIEYLIGVGVYIFIFVRECISGWKGWAGVFFVYITKERYTECGVGVVIFLKCPEGKIQVLVYDGI